ncbi:carboxypeptidase regulatory-like domain-containing protein [Curtobacterium sp. RRHDQ66]|uniref:carboxypeptidase regulatory-like domain-containing protein n=1 Tax=Curtobacterium guangdongense TaxID=3413380 RepID=UPI003BF02A75
MRRWRMVTAGLTGFVLATGLALGGATSASAAPAQHWGDFTVSGTGKDYNGTMTMPGFPATTFKSNASQATVISGASTWQSAATGPGQLYGSSKGRTYINQRPNANNAGSPSVTTYTFDGSTPVGSWSFVLGDIDADQATITATVAGGRTFTPAQLGYQGSYNSCSVSSPGGWSCTPDPDGTTGQDKPTWNESTGTLTGNAAANDTAGASAWFTPTVPLLSLTVSYQWRSGFPVYQTWFASRTAALTGVATLDTTPIPGATVTATDANGLVHTTTTKSDGSYNFADLPALDGYRVEITPPAGAAGDAETVADLNSGDVPATKNFSFTAPDGTVSVIGTVTAEDGTTPVAHVPVVIIDPTNGSTLVTTETNSEGVYTGSGLPPGTDLAVSADGGDPVAITTGEAGAPPEQLDPIAAPPTAVATISGAVTLDATAVPAGVVVDLLDADGNVLASTTTGAGGKYEFTTVPGAYTVRSALPAEGAEGSSTLAVDTTGGLDVTDADFAFTTPEPAAPQVVDQPGTVTDTNGDPVAGVQVVATPTDPDAGVPVTTTTGPDGAFVLPGLNPTSEYEVVVGPGDDPGQRKTITTPATGAGNPLAFVVPAAATPTPTPPPTSGGGSDTTPVSSTGGSSSTGALAYTGADLTPGLIAAGVLVLLGAGLLTFRAARNRRRSEHLQD